MRWNLTMKNTPNTDEETGDSFECRHMYTMYQSHWIIPKPDQHLSTIANDGIQQQSQNSSHNSTHCPSYRHPLGVATDPHDHTDYEAHHCTYRHQGHAPQGGLTAASAVLDCCCGYGRGRDAAMIHSWPTCTGRRVQSHCIAP